MSLEPFRYEAIDESGTLRRGLIKSTDEASAFDELSRRGLTPLRLAQERRRALLTTRAPIRRTDVAALTRELSSLVEAHIPLEQGLTAIAEHETRPAMREMVLDLATMIESGDSITHALSKYRSVFGDVYVETMRAAEASGSLSEVLLHLAEMLERETASAQQVRRALTYPVIVLSCIAVALVVIVTVVIPRFADTFSRAGVELPIMTRVLQAIGEELRVRWWAYAGAGVAHVVAVWSTWRSTTGRAAIEELLLRVPLVRRLLLTSTAACFSRIMAIALEAGVDLIETIQIAARASGRPLFVREADVMAERLRGGERLAAVLEQSRYLPPFARRLIGCGNESSEVARASRIVSKHYDRETDHFAKSIGTLVEPLMTIGLALIVTIVALSVFLPMWQMVRVNR